MNIYLLKAKEPNLAKLNSRVVKAKNEQDARNVASQDEASIVWSRNDLSLCRKVNIEEESIPDILKEMLS